MSEPKPVITHRLQNCRRKNSSMPRLTLIAAVALSGCLALFAQDPKQPQNQPQKQGKEYTIKADVELVLETVSVLDKEGRPFDGLTKDNFQVFEDNVSQQIESFRHEDSPISLGLVIDNSGSMRNKRERVNSAALTFVRDSNPEDETFIINFDDQAYLEQDFTGSIGDLVDALDNIDTRGETALNDAIWLSVNKAKEGKREKKALLLITDGEDDASKYNLEKVLAHLKESKVTLYAIGLLEENDERGGLFHAAPSKKAKDALLKYAEVSGGAAYFPKTVDEVEAICKKIATDLRNNYTIGYIPKNSKLDGTWRDVKVTLTPPKGVTLKQLTVGYKQGYVAPLADPPGSDR